MQRDTRLFTGKASAGHGYEVGGYDRNTPVGGHYTYGIPLAPALGATLAGTNQECPGPINEFEFQPSENCPKNFIIFDQTDNRSRVMFHPALAHKFSCPNFNISATHAHDDGKNGNNENEDKLYSSLKEDTEDIDALLSSEEDEEDDVVSTGRAPGNWGGSSPDSSSSIEEFKSRKMKHTSQESFSSGTSSSERKRERMRKMVRALRGIIPGGERMDTPAILDEAVRYLKSLKVEVKKLGIQNF